MRCRPSGRPVARPTRYRTSSRARFAGHSVSELAADSGHASQDSYATLARLNTQAMIPPRPGAKHVAEHARERMRTPVGRDAAIDRQAHAECAIVELKHHGAGRARCRGTRLVQLQLLTAATAINRKRLIAAQHASQRGQTRDPATHAAAITSLTGLLARVLDEITHLAADSSTGSW